jgi:hypothetical protein
MIIADASANIGSIFWEGQGLPGAPAEAITFRLLVAPLGHQLRGAGEHRAGIHQGVQRSSHACSVLFRVVTAFCNPFRCATVSCRARMCRDGPARSMIGRHRPIVDRHGAENAAAARCRAGRASRVPIRRRPPRSVPSCLLGGDGGNEGAPDQGAQLSVSVICSARCVEDRHARDYWDGFLSSGLDQAA